MRWSFRRACGPATCKVCGLASLWGTGRPVTFEALVDVVRTLGKYWLEIVELPDDADDGR